MHAGTLFTATWFFTEQNGKSHEQGQVTHRPSAKHSSSRVSPLRTVIEDSLPLSGGGNNSLGFLCLIEFATEQNRKDSDFVQTKKLLWHSILPKTYLTIWTCVYVCIFTYRFLFIFRTIVLKYSIVSNNLLKHRSWKNSGLVKKLQCLKLSRSTQNDRALNQ